MKMPNPYCSEHYSASVPHDLQLDTGKAGREKRADKIQSVSSKVAI